MNKPVSIACEAYSTSTTVPEPATGILATVTVAVLFTHRRKTASRNRV
jgi:hypothetical protein